MIYDDFCLLPAWFCYVIIHVRNLESHMHIADRCAPWKFYTTQFAQATNDITRTPQKTKSQRKGIWIGNWIYWTLTTSNNSTSVFYAVYNSLWIHFIFTSPLVTASNGDVPLFFGFPNCPGLSHSNFQLANSQ
jgi:hypothetical protein